MHTSLARFSFITLGIVVACSDDSENAAVTPTDSGTPGVATGGTNAGGSGGTGAANSVGGTGAGTAKGGAGGSHDGGSGMPSIGSGGAGGNGGASGGTGGDVGTGGSTSGTGGSSGSDAGVGGNGGIVATGGSPTVDAGTGGSPAASGGAGGGTVVGPPGSNVEDPVVNPVCLESPGNGSPYTGTWDPPSDLVSSLIGNGACCALYATQPEDQMAVLAWNYGDPTNWYGWQCFSAVPEIRRMAATNVQSGMSEQYALSLDGLLWKKREYSTGRGPWLHMARPAAAAEIRDIHAFRRSAFRPMVLALSEGAAFIRGRKTDAPDSEFADWQTIGPVQGTRICGGYAHDDEIQVYVLTSDGTLAVAQEDAAGSGQYSSFVAVTSPGVQDAGTPPKFTEIDCATDTDATLNVFAVSESGELFRLREGSVWSRIESISGTLVAGAIAAQSATPFESTSKPYNDLTLYATTPGGAVYTTSLPMVSIPDGGAPAPVDVVNWSGINFAH